MSESDEKELSSLLLAGPPGKIREKGNKAYASPVAEAIQTEDSKPGNPDRSDYVQWSVLGNGRYLAVGLCKEKLPPGIYDIKSNSQIGTYFESAPFDIRGIIRFPDTVTDEVLEEISKFWDREQLFKKYKTTYKRGILLWGPPGSGKTCTIKLLVEDLIKRDGIVLKFSSPGLFSTGLKMLRAIQLETPIIVLMEDIDAIISSHNESEVINILDGIDALNKIVFIATTNYPELLGARIINRPSRFDKRHKVGVPSKAARKMYFEHLLGNCQGEVKGDIAQWVKDTDGMSIAHLKELFVGHVLLGEEYGLVVKRLVAMAEPKSSSEDELIASTAFTS